ncbi:ATP-binding protein [Enterovirga aerilata]|uniref:histidine kinase n=1 Tax=Enterovirga aerilata TaxID=2730920 RepID=A0A849I818_9HYPH|nr:ATP-binding protein [Enterovirga sp. DB1703]NNM73924.1 response regulator [Enterovirga sp. DB1703]
MSSSLTAPSDFGADVVAVEGIAAVPTILEVICRTTGMGFAAVARVTEERWVACAVKDDIAFGLEPGGELKVETTICHEIRQSGTAVVIDNVEADLTYCGHPTAAMYGFQSYVSMPIVLPNGSFWGTLCAIDPRPARVDTPETVGMFKMFAELIGFHLDANLRVATSTAKLRLYENIVQSDTAPICVFDTEYRLIAFNKAHNDEFRRVNGFDTKLGDVFPDLFIPEQAEVMRGLMGRALAGESFKVEAVFGRPEYGQPAWEITYTPLRDEAGEIIGAFHHAHDISARLTAEANLRSAQDTLRQSQKLEAVGQLTGGVAHDFNNLLTVIKSSSDLLKRPNLPEERRSRYVDAISDTVDRATKLTAQLLAFARRQSLKPEVFEIADALRGTADMVATVIGARVQIAIELPDQPCYVRADRSQFETALVNMAVNARDAMHGEGKLTLHLSCGLPLPPIRRHAGAPGPFVRITVTDTGEGIPGATLGRIFEPFFTTKEVGRGTGLGLSQVFGFAKQSGGDIDVASEIGIGTTFSLYLPEAQEVAAESGVVDQQVVFPGEALRVLVVEDNAAVGSSLTEALSDLGFETSWAVDAREALDHLSRTPSHGFDVVFSDVVMPGMSGLEMAQLIRHRHPAMPVVLTSGYSHVLADEGRHGFELMQKPYSVDQLAQVLRGIVGRKNDPATQSADFGGKRTLSARTARDRDDTQHGSN